MTIKQAYEKVCNYMKERPTVIGCREYSSAFGFFVAAPGTNTGKPAFVGGSMICVDKVSGRVYTNDDDEFDLYGKRWTSVPRSDLTMLK